MKKRALSGLAAIVLATGTAFAEGNIQELIDNSTQCLNTRDYDCALNNLREAYRIDPHNAELHNNIAMYHFKTKNPDEQRIIDHIERAVSLDPTEARFYQNMGLIFKTLGKRVDDPLKKHTYFSKALKAYEMGLNVAEPGSDVESTLIRLTQIMQDKYLD